METLKHVWFLISAFIVSTICLLSCSTEMQNTNSDFAVNQNATDFNSISNQNVANQNSNSNIHPFDEKEFERNKNLWDGKNIKSYRMILELKESSDAAKQVLIEVQNRQIKSIKRTSETDDGRIDLYEKFGTIEKIFKIIERARMTPQQKLDVEYDETLGNPLQVLIIERFDVAENEKSIAVKNLEIIR